MGARALSFRWGGIKRFENVMINLPGNRCSSSFPCPTTFLNVKLPSSGLLWVDFLNHFGIHEKVSRTVETMGSVYDSHKVIPHYVLTGETKEAIKRVWIYQEIIACELCEEFRSKTLKSAGWRLIDNMRLKAGMASPRSGVAIMNRQVGISMVTAALTSNCSHGVDRCWATIQLYGFKERVRIQSISLDLDPTELDYATFNNINYLRKKVRDHAIVLKDLRLRCQWSRLIWENLYGKPPLTTNAVAIPLPYWVRKFRSRVARKPG
jgi:hypothetical protein